MSGKVSGSKWLPSLHRSLWRQERGRWEMLFEIIVWSIWEILLLDVLHIGDFLLMDIFISLWQRRALEEPPVDINRSVYKLPPWVTCNLYWMWVNIGLLGWRSLKTSVFIVTCKKLMQRRRFKNKLFSTGSTPILTQPRTTPTWKEEHLWRRKLKLTICLRGKGSTP